MPLECIDIGMIGNTRVVSIWVKQVASGDPLRLTSDAADEYEPTFSPDGSSIVFRSERDGGGLYTMPVLGGEPSLIAKAGREPRFSPDGSRLAFVEGGGGLSGGARGEAKTGGAQPPRARAGSRWPLADIRSGYGRSVQDVRRPDRDRRGFDAHCRRRRDRRTAIPTALKAFFITP